MKCPALFLDRDGVINVDHGYVHNLENFEFTKNIFDLVRVANELGYRVIVVTNQAGIGRGYYTETQFKALTEWMLDQFQARGTKIDAVYFCPFHPEYGIGPYKLESEFRKPAPGMLLQAAKDFNLDLNSSVMVGDKATDIIAAERAGVANRFIFRSMEICPTATPVNDFHEVINHLRIFKSIN